MANPTLEDYNETENSTFKVKYTPALNGIDCGKCGTELKDLYPGQLTVLFPPMTDVRCDTCAKTFKRHVNS